MLKFEQLENRIHATLICDVLWMDNDYEPVVWANFTNVGVQWRLKSSEDVERDGCIADAPITVDRGNGIVTVTEPGHLWQEAAHFFEVYDPGPVQIKITYRDMVETLDFIAKEIAIADVTGDNLFTSADLVFAFRGGKYDTGEFATKEQGDWNNDGVFDSGDLVAAFQQGTYTE